MQVDSFDEYAKGPADPITLADMDAHRIGSIFLVLAGGVTALLGLAIVTVAVMVRTRVSRRRSPSFDV